MENKELLRGMTKNKAGQTRFRILQEQGMDISDVSGLVYKMPYLSEFEGCRLSDTDVEVCSTGQRISVVQNNIVVAMESGAVEDIAWTVDIHAKRGVHVYRDVEMTEYMYTLPRGIRMIVSGRAIRDGKLVYHIWTGFGESVSVAYIGVDAYRQMLHTPVVFTEMKCVLFGRVKNVDGLVVRKTKEIYSEVIGHLSMGSIVYIDGKDFSDVPQELNVQRYRLVGERGWINVYHKGQYYEQNVEIYGYVPTSEKKWNVLHEMAIVPCYAKPGMEMGNGVDVCISCMTNERDVLFLHDGDYGHRLCCMKCANMIMARKMGCPVCRLPIKKVVQIF